VNSVLHKFPSTPHLAWLGSQPVREDKVLTPDEVGSMLAHTVEVEEKIDGANLGISFDEDGSIRFQNRGNWLEGKLTGQWERLRGWVARHEASLRAHLPPNHVLFGEWCYAKHSVFYDRLPDWFVAFDIYDSSTQQFWSTERRDTLLQVLGIIPVPKIASGRFTLQQLTQMLDAPSAFGTEPREGIYMRQEQNGRLVTRAKLVCPEFVQQIGEHWSSGAIQPNRLDALATASLQPSSFTLQPCLPPPSPSKTAKPTTPPSGTA
jgi:hypothetical protein